VASLRSSATQKSKCTSSEALCRIAITSYPCIYFVVISVTYHGLVIQLVHQPELAQRFPAGSQCMEATDGQAAWYLSCHFSPAGRRHLAVFTCSDGSHPLAFQSLAGVFTPWLRTTSTHFIEPFARRHLRGACLLGFAFTQNVLCILALSKPWVLERLVERLHELFDRLSSPGLYRMTVAFTWRAITLKQGSQFNWILHRSQE
jgi:hypothetical protein